MKDVKIGDVLMMDGKVYVSMEMYKSLLNDLKYSNKMLDIFIEEREYQKKVIENRNNMKISRI